MLINTTITLAPGDVLAKSATDAAAEVLAAFGGDPEKDYATVTVTMTPESASHGTPPVPQPA